jgi:hypothetical protein
MSKLALFVRSVDWPRVLHMGGTFLRALSEDPKLAADDATARGMAEKLRKVGEQAARQSSGCTGSSDCKCVVCRELGCVR